MEAKVKEISITGGQVVLVDDEDYERVSGYIWFRHLGKGTDYAMAHIPGRVSGILLHRFILDAPDGVLVDHKNRNGLDCQRQNIRLATSSQNGRNAAKYRTFKGAPVTSRFKGVHWCKYHKHWLARANIGGRVTHLGQFDSEEAAARAYNNAALLHFGEFARLNAL
jgi:hypothetical protein